MKCLSILYSQPSELNEEKIALCLQHTATNIRNMAFSNLPSWHNFCTLTGSIVHTLDTRDPLDIRWMWARVNNANIQTAAIIKPHRNLAQQLLVPWWHRCSREGRPCTSSIYHLHTNIHYIYGHHALSTVYLLFVVNDTTIKVIMSPCWRLFMFDYSSE